MARRETAQEARERIWGNQGGAPSREREESNTERDRGANAGRDREADAERDRQANAERDRESNGGRERGSNGDRDRGGSTRRDNRQSGQSDSTGGVLKRTIREFKEDNLTDWAAALTYYGILSIFPAIIALVSILGIVGSSATQPLLDNLGSVAPGPAKDIFTSAIQNLQKSSGTAGILFIVGLAGALWSASGYVAAFMRASNSIYDIEEGRPIWKTLPTRIGTTVVLLVLLAVVAIGVVVTGGLAKQVGNLIGLGDTAVSVWNIAKWPVMLLLVAFMFAFLYWAAPNVKHPKFSIITPGGILAVVIWLVASAAFAFYVANFGSYNKTYGALGGVITFLVWLWISNIAILLGAEFNAERERGHQMERGHPADEEPFLEPRDTRKMENA
jgi:membrane protein